MESHWLVSATLFSTIIDAMVMQMVSYSILSSYYGFSASQIMPHVFLKLSQLSCDGSFVFCDSG